MKCRKIEIFNNQTKEWDIVPVSAVFNLAVLDNQQSYYKHGFWGINIGVAIPMKNSEENNEFNHKYLKCQDRYCTINGVLFYLLGENEEKVPVLGYDGNCYMESYGSCCLFGYLSPDILAGDEYPKKNKDKAVFGSLPMEFNQSSKE